MAAVRRKGPMADRDLGVDQAGRNVFDKAVAYTQMREQRSCFQVVAASATVSEALVSELQRALPLAERPELLRAAPDANRTAQLLRGGARGRGVGPAAVCVPQLISHFKAEVPEEEAKPAAAARLLRQLKPRAALLVLKNDAPITAFVAQLRAHGVSSATMLHEAMGFPSRGGDTPGTAAAAVATAAAATPAHSAAALLRRFDPGLPRAAPARERTLGRGDVGAPGVGASVEVAAASGPMVWVTTEMSCRGLDLPDLDCVLLFHAPLTSDAYTHIAGRTGRGRASERDGTVVSVLTDKELPFLGLFTSQLKIAIKQLRIQGSEGPAAATRESEPVVEREASG